MRPAPFAYQRPHTLDSALRAVAAGSTPLLGGQTLIQNLRLRRTMPSAIVDLSHVAEFSEEVLEIEGNLHIGARVTHAKLARHPLIEQHVPWLVEAALRIGDVQVRNRGTVLGNLCWADPRANMAVALLASDASVIVAELGNEATRAIAVDDLFESFQRTILGPRLAIGIIVPKAPAERVGIYLEQSRQPQDLALVNTCVVIGRNFKPVRVAVGGIHQTPLRMTAVEEILEATGSAAALEGILDHLLLSQDLAPLQDNLATPQFRLHLAQYLIKSALKQRSEGA
jgi:carbon-monoxide dehydrogenase medium subunit